MNKQDSLIPIESLAEGGINWDVPAAQLPPNVFTDALNVRFRNKAIYSTLGESLYATVASLTPEYGIHWPRPVSPCDIFAKDAKICKRLADGTESLLYNPGSGHANATWMFDLFGGGYAVIANDGNSTPKYALYNDTLADNAFIDFPGWNYGGNTVTAKIIRPFGYALAAANLTVTKGGNTTYAPVTVRVSVQAPIGGFPAVWEPGISTDTADEFEINSKSGIVEMRELRGNLFIYSSDSISMLSRLNGVTTRSSYMPGYGALNANCVVEFDGKHFAVDRNTIYVHNGTGVPQSVSEGRIGDRFFQEVDTAYLDKVFCICNTRFSEILVAYPMSGSSGLCVKAVVYNYKNNTWTARSLPAVSSLFISRSIVSSTFSNKLETLIGCQKTAKTFLFDSGNLMYNGTDFVPFLSYVSREKLFLGNPLEMSYIGTIAVLLLVQNDNDTVTIRVSGGDVYDRAVNWTNTDGREAFTVQPRQLPFNHKIDPRSINRFVDLRVEGLIPWKLVFIGLNVSPGDAR